MSDRETAVNNIIDSVASEQVALAQIIEAEAKKITVATENYSDNDELLSVNKSVESMLNTITKLEIVLHSKLQLFDYYLSTDTTDTTN